MSGALPRLFVSLVAAAAASTAHAGVSVVVDDPNTATATISLTSPSGSEYDAVVTLSFDQAVNLSAGSLGLSAELIDPASPPAVLPVGVSVDPAFPVLISIEPPVATFRNGYETDQIGDGNLAFFNTYQIEVHTADLACSSTKSPYRLYKAPHGSTTFADVTDDVLSGSVRARGRGGAFSQFLVVKDKQASLLVATAKLANLSTRLLASTLDGTLLATLTSLLATVSTDLLTLNIAGAIDALDTFIADVTAASSAGEIANEWVAGGALSNDAGDLLSLAQTLRFTLLSLEGSPLCQPPPP
ncbi:MAG TPA: DUF6689 family protein [Rudaea sp.]|nr:DUF6689 family protein [Rudaea sp.]